MAQNADQWLLSSQSQRRGTTTGDDVDAGPAYSPDDQKRFPENQDLRESPLEGE